jgi:hypothetical protein
MARPAFGQSTNEDAMCQPDDVLALAERHVQEAEERVARQAATLARLEEAGHGWAADQSRMMLAAMRESLNMARAHLVILRAMSDEAAER